MTKQKCEEYFPWISFDDKSFNEGLFWFLFQSPDYELDVTDAGQLIGIPTGQLRFDVHMANIKRGLDGSAEFNFINKKELHFSPSEAKVVAYAEIIKPRVPGT